MDNPYKKKLRTVDPFTTEVYEDGSEEWRWRIKAGNGEIIGASSEGFASKQNALNNFRLLADKISIYCDSKKEDLW